MDEILGEILDEVFTEILGEILGEIFTEILGQILGEILGEILCEILGEILCEILTVSVEDVNGLSSGHLDVVHTALPGLKSLPFPGSDQHHARLTGMAVNLECQELVGDIDGFRWI